MIVKNLVTYSTVFLNTVHSGSTVFRKSYLIFFFANLWKNKIILKQTILFRFCYAMFVWYEFKLLLSHSFLIFILNLQPCFYLPCSLFSSSKSNFFPTSNVKDVVYQLYCCRETSILPRVSRMNQLHKKKIPLGETGLLTCKSEI